MANSRCRSGHPGSSREREEHGGHLSRYCRSPPLPPPKTSEGGRVGNLRHFAVNQKRHGCGSPPWQRHTSTTTLNMAYMIYDRGVAGASFAPPGAVVQPTYLGHADMPAYYMRTCMHGCNAWELLTPTTTQQLASYTHPGRMCGTATSPGRLGR